MEEALRLPTQRKAPPGTKWSGTKGNGDSSDNMSDFKKNLGLRIELCTMKGITKETNHEKDRHETVFDR